MAANITGVTLSNGSVGTSGTGAALYNDGLLTLTSVTISGNTASGSGLGGGVYNDQNGVMVLINSTISGNTAGSGGAIYNAASGNVAMVDSTISGNTANGAAGGGIYNDGTLSLMNTTVSANSTVGAGNGGGVFSGASSTLSLENSIIAGNTSAAQYADLNAANGFVPDSSNVAGTDPSATSLVSASLAPLANYGGTALTMIPLPGSPAICGGVVANIPAGTTSDQRGTPRTTTYASTPCVDAGSVQTNYSLLFVQQPTDVLVGSNIAPAPSVQLNESGAVFGGASATIALNLSGNGVLSGGSASTANGVATYSAASVSASGTSDTLAATLPLNSGTNTSISTTSNTFNVIAGVSQLAYGTPPAANVTAGGNAGSAITVQAENAGGTIVTTSTDTITLTVTGPNGYNQIYTATAINGVATFNLSNATLSATGSYLYLATSGTLSSAVTSETVGQAAASTLVVVSGSGQATSIGTSFTQALTVKVLDASNNPVSGAVVSFSAPGSGASASLSSMTATSGVDGMASVMATANGIAALNPYNVTAAITGNIANFSLTNTQAGTSLSVATSATGLVYGQPVTIKANVSPASVLTAMPTGTILFYDGTTALPPAITIASAAASNSVPVPAVGSHTYQAQYNGDANFSASALTAAKYPLVVSKASSTLNGPAMQPVTFPVGTGGTTQVTLVGQYSGTGISQPAGTVSYTANGMSGTAMISSGTATINIPSTLPAGSYTMTVMYAGDGNYDAAPSITIPISVTAAGATTTTTMLTATPASVAAGGSVAFTATVTPTSGTAIPTGTVAFTSGTSTLGTATLNASGVATFTTTTLPVGKDSVIAVYSGAGSFSGSTSSADVVTVTASTATPSATTLTSSNATAAAGTSVMFTATVTPATPAPTGSVTFSDGTTVLGTGTLNGAGVATYSTAALTAGTHSIKAAYSGDTNYAASMSSELSETITAAATPSFTIAANPASLTIAQGQSGTIQFTLTSVNGFNQAVTLTCGSLPAQTTCTLPGPVTPTASGATASVTINTDASGTSARLQQQEPSNAGRGSFTALAGAGLAGLALLFGFPARKRLRRLSGLYTVMMALALSGALAAMSVGCGTTATTPTGTSVVTITATAGTGATAVTQSVSVELVVTK